MAVALTYWQEIEKSFWSALFTAVFTGVFAAGIGTWLTKKWEQRREVFTLRNVLLNQSTSCAQRMFASANNASRQIRDAGNGKQSEAKARDLLETAHLDFTAEAEPLKQVLGARYGFDDFADPRDGTSPSSVYGRWRHIKDLLDVLYYGVKENFPGDSAARNSRGHEGEYRSGIDLSFWAPTLRPTYPNRPESYRDLRERVRKEYKKAMPQLAEAILYHRITTR